MLVAAGGYLLAAPLLLPALLVHSLPLAVPLIFFSGLAMSAPIAPLDAVRLDVIHPRLWGRAEGTRNVLLIVFADLFGGSGADGTRDTFLIMLSALIVSRLILLSARRHYSRDAAAAARAAESARATA